MMSPEAVGWVKDGKVVEPLKKKTRPKRVAKRRKREESRKWRWWMNWRR